MRSFRVTVKVGCTCSAVISYGSRSRHERRVWSALTMAIFWTSCRNGYSGARDGRRSPISLLTVEDAVVSFGETRALDGVSLNLDEGETLAIVGESGCGKTTLARAILGLQPLTSGTITLAGRQIKRVEPGQATTLGMVWQDPYASLDPRWTIGRSVLEPVLLSKQNRPVAEILAEVGLDEAAENKYPHQLSGGQRQRAAIGRALSVKPPLVICDEPTAALDLSTQAQILNLLRDIQDANNCAYLYISHDLTTVRFLADRVCVMYMGQIVESGPTEHVFSAPMHPYTANLIESAPTLENLGQLPPQSQGEVFGLRPSTGCLFEPRCTHKQQKCVSDKPPIKVQLNVSVKCHFPLASETSLSSHD